MSAVRLGSVEEIHMTQAKHKHDERTNIRERPADKSKEKGVRSEADDVEEKQKQATQSPPDDGGFKEDNPNEHG
jgi:hypothetical protein